VVREILGVEVQEQDPLLIRGERREGTSADAAAEVPEAAQTLGGVQEAPGVGEGRLFAAEQRLVAVELPAVLGHDGLERDPQALEGELEAGLEGSPAAFSRVGTELLEREALRRRQAVELDRAAHR